MNEQTRELMLELKKNCSLAGYKSCREYYKSYLDDGFDSNEELIFYIACKLMVACGFGDEIV